MNDAMHRFMAAKKNRTYESLANKKTVVRLEKIALALPEAAGKAYGTHRQYVVGKKTFAYFLDNHHGDGIVSVTMKVAPGENTRLTNAAPDRFYIPAYIGSKGWVALRLDVKIDWNEVDQLLRGSYR